MIFTKKSMTALVSAFSRAYHSENERIKVFDDSVAKKLLTGEEYNQISENMAGGISFFNPQFCGTKEQALRWAVNNVLAPAPLGRAAFAEDALKTAAMIGAKQYLIFAAGYDTFAYRRPLWARELRVFELDRPEMLADKRSRLKNAGIEELPEASYIPVDFAADWASRVCESPLFCKDETAFCSLLGLIYYLKKEDFIKLVSDISALLPQGSSLAFDYPNEKSACGSKRSALAKGANEQMQAFYSYEELEGLLAGSDFNIYEHLDADEISKRFFNDYNLANEGNKIMPEQDVSYCLAVKK